MAETLSTLSIISFVVAAICLVLAIFLWVFLKIPTVIGDLSGRTARKSIARMRSANEKTGSKSYKECKSNVERGKLTDTMRQTKKNARQAPAVVDDRPNTGLLNENRAEEARSELTAILGPTTTGLLVDEDATAPLEKPQHSPLIKREGGVPLQMLDDVFMIHTDEVI